MRSMSAAVLVALLLLVAPSSASAHDGDLREYARGTWASFVAMTDERSGLPADSLHKDGTRSVQTSTTNIGAYMWSAVVAHRLGLISTPSSCSGSRRRLSTLKRMERSTAASTGTGTTTGRARSSPPGRRTPRALPQLAVVGRQRLARRRPADRPEQRAASCPSGPARSIDSMDFGIYYVPERNLVRFHIDPTRRPTRALAVLLRHGGQREPDRRLPRHRARPAAAEDLLPALAHVPAHAATGAGRRHSPSAPSATYSA